VLLLGISHNYLQRECIPTEWATVENARRGAVKVFTPKSSPLEERIALQPTRAETE